MYKRTLVDANQSTLNHMSSGTKQSNMMSKPIVQFVEDVAQVLLVQNCGYMNLALILHLLPFLSYITSTSTKLSKGVSETHPRQDMVSDLSSVSRLHCII
jgi:hypothetical protein